MVISNVHRSLNAGHRENYTQSVTGRTRKRDILAKRKDSFTAIQKNLNKGKHKVKLTKNPTMIRSRGNGRRLPIL
ncbi:unnamed protein product [Pocillopora meandrina]|uniref:Uncharacterized protein n=1 Tax=Pocillopora meandrina TaxID=46732 RepID=A0AAU9X1N3_9CNID|nr:unnamed protein product [Pocillopora meandrina]